MRDDLKQKAQQLAQQQGVSLNGYINATLSAAIAQQETLSLFSDRMRNVDQETLRKRVLKFMRQQRPGSEPTPEEVQRAIGETVKRT